MLLDSIIKFDASIEVFGIIYTILSGRVGVVVACQSRDSELKCKATSLPRANQELEHMIHIHDNYDAM